MAAIVVLNSIEDLNINELSWVEEIYELGVAHPTTQLGTLFSTYEAQFTTYEPIGKVIFQ